ncbi:MAG: DUF3892 domain-containing protein [Clostridiaceae bacterium]
MYIDLTGGHTICKIVKNPEGEVIGYQLENNERISREQAITLARQGAINGVSVEVSQQGEEYLKTLPKDDGTFNLTNFEILEEQDWSKK